MNILWDKYVFRRGSAVHALWDDLFANRKSHLLYIAGCGFDVRVTNVLNQFLSAMEAGKYQIDSATLVLIEFSGYELEDDLKAQTRDNCDALRDAFEPHGKILSIPMELAGGADLRVSHALQEGTRELLNHVNGCTDVILDVSSLPRVVYLALMTGLLDYLVPEKSEIDPLAARGVNLQILVAEDAYLDGKIKSEDLSEDLVLIPGFGGGIKVESMGDWPVVWFPILGEGRTSQFEKVASLAEIPSDAEICPVVPHPSKDPRRGDNLLLEFRLPLFASRQTPMSNVMYAHESLPFEAYRQVRNAIERYLVSLQSLGGCRILVTPLSSKLITIAAGLACFEMKPVGEAASYALGIPYAAPTRYGASRQDLLSSRPELSALLLTGSAYSRVGKRA